MEVLPEVVQVVERLVEGLEAVREEGQEEEIEVGQLEVVREVGQQVEGHDEVVQEVEMKHEFPIQVHAIANICLVLKISL